MKIDIKDIRKIKLKKDEILYIETPEGTDPHHCEVIRKILEEEGIKKLIVSSIPLKMTKLKEVK